MSAIKCNKCNGKGHIDGFMHVANGICFQCGGSGVLPEAKKKTVTYSRAFVQEFSQNGFCDSLLDLNAAGFNLVKWISLEDHPTAKRGLFTDRNYYIDCQPICRSSLWYKFPANILPEFQQHMKKSFKIDYNL